MIRWTAENVALAVSALSEHSSINRAIDDITSRVGFVVTRDSLEKTLTKYGYQRAVHHLRKGIPPVDQRDTERFEVATPVDDDLQTLLEATKRETIDLEAACDLLGKSPKAVRELVSEARSAGYVIDLDGARIGRRPSSERDGVADIAIQNATEWRTFAVASDIHVGSKFFLRDQFVHFVHLAHERGIRTILGPGDILDGVYKHSQWEEYAHGFDEQAEDAASVFPRLPGLHYYMIAGNHDQTHEASSGLDFCKSFADVFRRHGRDDLTMLGTRGATVELRADGDTRGLRVELWHPLGGRAYALSYKLQRKIEGYAVGAKPDVLLTGHWHQQCYFTQRGVHAMSCGTFHGGKSPFGRALGTSPAIGGWIVEYAQTPDGTVRSFRPEWISYYEHEQPRAIAV